MAFAWLDAAVAEANQRAAGSCERFAWQPASRVAEEDLRHCEEVLGVALSPSHRELLRRCNGAEFLYSFGLAAFGIKDFTHAIRLLPIDDIISERDRLRQMHDEPPGPPNYALTDWKWGS